MSEWVLWAFKPETQPVPIKIMGGKLSQCRAEQTWRTAHGWTCGIYGAGTAPTGLRDQARQ